MLQRRKHSVIKVQFLSSQNISFYNSLTRMPSYSLKKNPFILNLYFPKNCMYELDVLSAKAERGLPPVSERERERERERDRDRERHRERERERQREIHLFIPVQS